MDIIAFFCSKVNLSIRFNRSIFSFVKAMILFGKRKNCQTAIPNALHNLYIVKIFGQIFRERIDFNVDSGISAASANLFML